MEVTVYQPDGPCFKCKSTKLALDAENIPYTTEVADEATINRYKAEGHSAFPIVVAKFGDDVTWTWSDYRRDHVKELAKLAS